MSQNFNLIRKYNLRRDATGIKRYCYIDLELNTFGVINDPESKISADPENVSSYDSIYT